MVIKTLAGIATMKGRERALIDAVDSLVNQVDEVHVYSINEPSPLIDAIFKHPNVKYFYGIDHGDAGKFHSYSKDVLFFACDDDLIYPKDYASTMIAASNRHPGAIISAHGRLLKAPVTNYYSNGTKYPCLGEVLKDVQVHCGGTGVMLLRGQLDLSLEDFKVKNMADIWVGILAKQQSIPIITIAHKAGWIKHTTKINNRETIHMWHKNNCHVQTEIAKQILF